MELKEYCGIVTKFKFVNFRRQCNYTGACSTCKQQMNVCLNDIL